MDIVNRIL